MVEIGSAKHPESLVLRENAMKVNELSLNPEKMSFADIGRKLVELSGSRDGIGLVVELTFEEEQVFCATFGMAVGKALCTLIADAVKANGYEPKFQFVYSDCVFRTTAALSDAGPARDSVDRMRMVDHTPPSDIDPMR